VATLQPTRLQVYFIDSDDFFMRHASGELETVHDSDANDERAMFFVRGTAETVKKLRWEPSKVHCTGWISALAPLYLKNVFADDPVFRNTKIVFSLFSDSFEGHLNGRLIEKLRADGFDDSALTSLTDGETPIDFIKLNKMAIDHADALVVSSHDVPQELLDYAIASGKPMLEYPGGIDADAYYNFYQSL